MYVDNYVQILMWTQESYKFFYSLLEKYFTLTHCSQSGIL